MDDAEYLAENMRDLDRAELYAASLSEPLDALTFGVKRSKEVFTALADDVPFCMFGVYPWTILGCGGSPWLLTSKEITKHQRQLIKWSAPVAKYWAKEMFSPLVNFIDARHKPALRWAKHVGFHVLPAQAHGPFNCAFHPIVMRREDV
jgi:hypothetical protein